MTQESSACIILLNRDVLIGFDRASAVSQLVDTILGGVDAAILERLAKVMSYMRVTAGVKPGKRLKKREKMRMLEGSDFAVRPLAGAASTFLLNFKSMQTSHGFTRTEFRN